MAIVVTRLENPIFQPAALVTGSWPSQDHHDVPTANRPSGLHRLLSIAADGGIMITAVWSIPFVIIALATPLALAILAALWTIRALQNAF